MVNDLIVIVLASNSELKGSLVKHFIHAGTHS